MYNIEIDNNEEVLKKYDLDSKTKYDLNILRDSKNLKKYYKDVILKYINTKGKEQFDNFNKYLKKLSLSKNTAIVDLGWRGTTQKIMIDILGQNINGLYLGLHSVDKTKLKDNYWTYLFSSSEDIYSKKIYSFMTLIEIIFSALHGSTIAYSSDSKNPYVLNKSANEDNIYIEKIQNGARKFASDLLIYKDDLEFNDSKKFMDALIKVGTDPTLKQAKILGNLYTENLNTRVLAKPNKLSYYLTHIKIFKNELMDSEWKIGFMKILFKINLPYYKIYDFLKNKKGENLGLNI